MKVLIVLAHPEHRSFNGAVFRTAVETLSAAGHEVRTSDLHATETCGFAEDIEEEIQKIYWCDLVIWQFPLWWFGKFQTGSPNGLTNWSQNRNDTVLNRF